MRFLLLCYWKWDYYLLLKYVSLHLLQVLTTFVLQLLTAAFDIVGFGLMARHIPFRGDSYYYRDTEVNKQRRPILLVLEPRHLPSHKWLNISNTVKKNRSLSYWNNTRMSSSVKKRENVILQMARLHCSLPNKDFSWAGNFYFCLSWMWNRKADDLECRNQGAVHRSERRSLSDGRLWLSVCE